MPTIINLNSARTGSFGNGPFGHELQDAFFDDPARHDVIDATNWVPIGGHSRGFVTDAGSYLIVSGEQLRPRW